MKTLPIVAGVVVFGLCLGAYITLSILGLDTTGLIAFIGVAAGAGGFAAWRNTEVIKEQTNGPLTATNETVARLDSDLTQVHEQLSDISKRLEAKGV